MSRLVYINYEILSYKSSIKIYNYLDKQTLGSRNLRQHQQCCRQGLLICGLLEATKLLAWPAYPDLKYIPTSVSQQQQSLLHDLWDQWLNIVLQHNIK